MAPIGCQNFLSPFFVTAYRRCVGRDLLFSFVMTLSFRSRARPNGGLDARSEAEAEKRGCHKRAAGPPKGAELHERSEPKRAGLIATRASAEPGTKRGRFVWWAGWFRKDDDVLKSIQADAFAF